MHTETAENALLEETLSIIVSALHKQPMSFVKNTGDGRLDSAANEDDVIERIVEISHTIPFFTAHGLKIGTPNLESNNNREWYDFAIESIDTSLHNLFMPVNVKITDVDGGAADNLSCKLGIFYALTGCLPKAVALGNGASWEKFFTKTDECMGKKQNKDYYFLVINKRNTADVFWNSLRRLPTLVENGNNLPFQCKWSENRVSQTRTYFEARDFLLNTLKGSINKREQIGFLFRKYLEKYIGTTLIHNGGAV